MRRLLALSALCAAASPARAETLVVRPDPCPAPPAQPLIIDLGDVELFNQWPEAEIGRVLVVYPPTREGWASARILMRFDLEPQQERASSPDCARPRIFRVPR